MICVAVRVDQVVTCCEQGKVSPKAPLKRALKALSCDTKTTKVGAIYHRQQYEERTRFSFPLRPFSHFLSRFAVIFTRYSGRNTTR